MSYTLALWLKKGFFSGKYCVGMASAGFLFLLSFVLLRFTRGQVGVPVVCDHLLDQWSVFVEDFDSFCCGLVRHCEAVCKERGCSYLAHREGLHMAYSGLNFIRTLRRARIRERLVAFAEKWAYVVSGLQRPRSSVACADIIAMGNSISKYVAVALQKNQVKMAAKYNSMDTMRCFMLMLEFCMGVMPTEYSEELHQWFLKRQCRRHGRDAAAELAYFGVLSCDCMNKAVGRMRKMLNATSQVCAATMYVLFCETRQAINRYSLRGLWYLIEQYDKSKSVRANVSRVRNGLESSVSTLCYTIQVLEGIRTSVGVSLAVLRKLPSKCCGGSAEVAYEIGRRRLCPKVELDGIPEFRVLASCLSVVYQKVQAGAGQEPQEKQQKYARQPSQLYRSVLQAAKGLGIKYVRQHKKKKLTVLVKRGMQKPSGTGARKRSYEELVSAVHARGGSQYERIQKQGRWITRRVSKVQLEALVAEP